MNFRETYTKFTTTPMIARIPVRFDHDMSQHDVWNLRNRQLRCVVSLVVRMSRLTSLCLALLTGLLALAQDEVRVDSRLHDCRHEYRMIISVVGLTCAA